MTRLQGFLMFGAGLNTMICFDHTVNADYWQAIMAAVFALFGVIVATRLED